MEFEWDAKKSASNKAKHGLSFEEVAAAILAEEPLAVVPNAIHPGQQLVVFRFGGDIYVAAVENRQGAVRIVSAQRRRKMRKLYGP